MADEEMREENVANIDFSQIRTSIQLGGRMIEQILNSVHYGSPEVRCLILDECDIILECRVCRGLFRALPNFIAHKRVYCKQAYVMTQQNIFDTLPEEDVVVVQPAAPEDISNSLAENSCLTEKVVDKSADEKLKDTICQITDGTLGKSEMYKLYSKAANKIDRQKKSKKSLDVVLSKIATNPNAVKVSYQEHTEEEVEASHIPLAVHQQVLSPSDGQMKIGSESLVADFVNKPMQGTIGHKSKSAYQDASVNISSVSDEDELSSARETIRSDKSEEYLEKSETTPTSQKCMKKKENKETWGKKSNVSISSGNTGIANKMDFRVKDSHGNRSPCNILDISLLKCLQCNTKYSSRKTLLYHVQMRHSGLRTFFPCPYCSNVFFYFWGLTRHLRVNHKKTHNQINKMRKKLREAAFTKSVTKPCIQAKDQLEFTTEISSPALEVSIDKNSSDIQTGTNNGVGMLKSGLGKKIVQHNKICSRATVKHTPKHIKHIFACRYVPTVENVKDGSLYCDKSQSSENRLGKAKKYNHQLFCDICRKVFWKKSRLTNHKKFCSSRKIASKSKEASQKFESCSCGKLLKKGHQEEHGQSCPERVTTERKQSIDFLKFGNLPNEDKDVMVGESVFFGCSFCKRTFGKKISLENHKRSCLKNADKRILKSSKKLIMADTVKQADSKKSKLCQGELKQRKLEQKSCAYRVMNVEVNADVKADCLDLKEEPKDEDEIHVVEEIWIHKQPGRPSEKVKSNRIYVTETGSAGRLHCQDTKKLSAIVDEIQLKCTKCGQEFTSVSNLQRHAIRHLGWKRFKCKLCRFSSYNRSECNTHIVKTHSEKYHFTSAESLIVDLNKEASRIRSQKNKATLSARQEVKNTVWEKPIDGASQVKNSKYRKKAEKGNKTVQKLKKDDPSRKFNISTRNSPRKFDTRPYQRFDSLSTLFTRKGYYPKPRLQYGRHGIDGSCSVSFEELQKTNTTEVHLSNCLQDSELFVKENKSLLNTNGSSDKNVFDKHIASDETESIHQLTTVLTVRNDLPQEIISKKNNLPEERFSSHGLLRGVHETKREISKGKKRLKSDCSSAPLKLLRTEKTVDNSVSQQPKKQPPTIDTKSSDFLAPWPRASEPMSVKEMFALIRRSPRAGYGGGGRRKSVGDTPLEHVSELCQAVNSKSGVRRSVGLSARTSPRTEGKANLGATLARRSSPAGNTLSLSLRTSRPGVDWSQSADKKIL